MTQLSRSFQLKFTGDKQTYKILILVIDLVAFCSWEIWEVFWERLGSFWEILGNWPNFWEEKSVNTDMILTKHDWKQDDVLRHTIW